MKNSLLAGRDFMPVQLELNRSFGEINYPFDELLNDAAVGEKVCSKAFSGTINENLFLVKKKCLKEFL